MKMLNRKIIVDVTKFTAYCGTQFYQIYLVTEINKEHGFIMSRGGSDGKDYYFTFDMLEKHAKFL